VAADPQTEQSWVRRLIVKVYGPGRGDILLDGPWWLGLLFLVVVTVLSFGSTPWKWLVVPVAVFFFWLPGCIRWGLGLWRSVGAFREGYRS
jgi:hypothetical protein